MKYLNLLITMFYILIISCTSGSNNKNVNEIQSGSGEYNFSIMDSNGTKLAEGVLSISENIEYKIKGSYNFGKVYNEFPGYSSMKGAFEGDINPESKTLLIDTNPGAADDNVFFNLKIKKDKMSGTWYYSAFRQQNTIGKVILIKNINQ